MKIYPIKIVNLQNSVPNQKLNRKTKTLKQPMRFKAAKASEKRLLLTNLSNRLKYKISTEKNPNMSK